jgi:CBS domain-containing protein
VAPHEVKDVDRDKWPQLTVADVILSLEKRHAVKPATSLNEALETMGREDINQLPVMSNGHRDGIISRSHILRLLQTGTELQV